MKTERFQHFMEQQRKEIDKYKWDLGMAIGRDPGHEAIADWISKYAKTFRKTFALGDIKHSLSDLRVIRSHMQEYIKDYMNDMQEHLKAYMNKIDSLSKIINDCEEKILEGVELLESEKENGNGQ